MEPVAAPDIPIGKRIKFYREGRGLSQADLGRRVNLAEDYISQIEEVTKKVRSPAMTCNRSALRIGIDIQPQRLKAPHFARTTVIAKAMT